MPPVPITCDFQLAPTECVAVPALQFSTVVSPPPVPPPRLAIL
jgi:hypothetical protein